MLLLAVSLGLASRALAQTKSAPAEVSLSVQAPSLLSPLAPPAAALAPVLPLMPLARQALPPASTRLPLAAAARPAAAPGRLAERLRADVAIFQGVPTRSGTDSGAAAGALFDLSRAAPILSADEPQAPDPGDDILFPETAVNQWKEDFKKVYRTGSLPAPGAILTAHDTPAPELAAFLARGRELGVVLDIGPGLYLYAAPHTLSDKTQALGLMCLLRAVKGANPLWSERLSDVHFAVCTLENPRKSSDATRANLALALQVRTRLAVAALIDRLDKLRELWSRDRAAAKAPTFLAATRGYLASILSKPELEPPDERQAANIKASLAYLRQSGLGFDGPALNTPREKELLGLFDGLATRVDAPPPPASPAGPAPGALDLWKREFERVFGGLRPYPGLVVSFDLQMPAGASRAEWLEADKLRTEGLALGALLALGDPALVYNAPYAYALPHAPRGDEEKRALDLLERAVKGSGKADWTDVLRNADGAVVLLGNLANRLEATLDNLELARLVLRHRSIQILLDRLDWLLGKLGNPPYGEKDELLLGEIAVAQKYLKNVRLKAAEDAREPIPPFAGEIRALHAAFAGLDAKGFDESPLELIPGKRALDIFGRLVERALQPHPRPSVEAAPPAKDQSTWIVPGGFVNAPGPVPPGAAPSPPAQDVDASLFTDLPPFELDPQEFPALATYTDNLVAMASEGKLTPLIGRRAALDRLLRTLTRWTKRNPMLVGPAGSGKSAIVEGLAQAIADGLVPEMEGKLIFRLDMAGLQAGTKYVGTFEERLQGLLDELKRLDGRGILFADEAHLIVGLGKYEGSENTMANLIKPALSRGELSMIGATTDDEYRLIEKDKALKRRFRKVAVEPATPEETLAILKGLRPAMKEHHGLRLPNETLKAAVRVAERHLKDLHFPDKAIDLLDEAASLSRLRGRSKVSEEDVRTVLADWTGIPVARMNESETARLRSLPPRLKARVVAQDEAVDRVAAAIRIAKADLRRAAKTVGAFIAVGPTGVGKTALAKALAEEHGMRLVRFNGSEFSTKESASRLIGADPGYIGHENPGELTEAVRLHPHSLVLMDELEEFHPAVRKLLLQIMDEGVLGDSRGQTVDFRNAIVWMTSNLGGQAAGEPPGIGFAAGGGAPRLRRESTLRELERVLEPKFMNRVDAVLFFNPLLPEAVEKILDLQLAVIQESLARRGLSLTLTPAARALILKEGFDPRLGARPLDRALARLLDGPLADLLIESEPSRGSVILADADGGRLRLDVAEPKR